MPSILLGKQSGSYLTGFVWVSVTDETESKSSMFQKYRHRPSSYHSPGTLYLYGWSHALGKYASLHPGTDYQNSKLEYADVYFNRFDTSYTPLVCVIKFSNGKDRIYKNSEHSHFVNRSSYANITSLSTFTQTDRQKELLEFLIEENYKSLNSVTYELDRTNFDQRETTYNSGRITLSSKQNVRSYNLNEFHKYTHTPNYPRFKKSFLLLGNNTPMSSRENPVRDIQGKEYDTINVYYNSRDKMLLMFELINNNKKIHFNRSKVDGSIWLKNEILDEDALLRYLNYTTGFVEREVIREQIKQQERESRGLQPDRRRKTSQERDRGKVSEPGPEISQETQITREQGRQTTQPRNETQERTISTGEKAQADEPPSRSLSPKLSLTGKICVLINKQETYKKTDVDTTCKTTDPESKIQDVQPENISVDCNDFYATGYKYYTHKIKPKLESFKGDQKQNIAIDLSIYISNIEIFLFHSSGVGREELIYQTNLIKPETNLDVYFYQENTKSKKTNIIPLMLHFNGKFYGPGNRDYYFSGWNRIGGIQGTSNTFDIKKRLDAINKELNRIELSNTGGGKCSYGLRQYIGVQINEFPTERVKVTIQSKNNYTRVIHRTINSFTIGSIMYGNEDITKGGINIKGTVLAAITIDKRNNHKHFVTTNNTNTVVCYYSKKDTGHKLPQLIVLMETDKPIEVSTDPMPAKSGSKYGYYVLATGTGDGSYKYEWIPVENPDKTPFQLDPESESSLLNAVVILVEQQSQYKELEISQAVKSSGIKSPGNESGVNRLTGKSITVNDCSKIHCTSENCVSKYGYIVKIHELTKATEQIFGINLVLGLRFLIPSENSEKQYNQLTLYKEKITESQNVDYLYHTTNQPKVYVWFYDKDPRPLLICYNGVGYAPKDQATYFKNWVKVDLSSSSPSLNQCCCPEDKEPVSDDKNNLLKELDSVVKFLNQVNLKEVVSNSQDAHKYTVQTFKNKQIQIEVECSRVGDSGSGSALQPGTCSIKGNKSCYKKFVHTHDGIQGDSSSPIGSGFRLGNVEYIGGDSNRHGILDYTKDGQHKYNPLKKVTVYFYDNDIEYKDPLLIELEFKVTYPSGKSGNLTEYYKFESVAGTGETDMKWTKDENAQTQMSNAQKLIVHLDSIRYSLKKVMRIEIDQNKTSQYDLTGRPSSGPHGSGFAKIGSSKQIHVVECPDSECSNLKAQGYMCFQHQISKISSSEQYKIAGLTMTLPAKEENQAVEIDLYSENGEKINKLFYNTCMGDVFVYFYSKKGSDNPDRVPLILRYNSRFYEPASRDEYFQKWEENSALSKMVKLPCGAANGKSDVLVTMLNMVNKELNRIELTHNMRGKPNSKYGLHKTHETSYEFNTNRVDVTKIPIENKPERPYCKLVHRTVNGFRIGDIYYGSDEILTNNVIIKETSRGSESTTITVDSTRNYKKFASNNNPNTVVVYYSTTDEHFKLPQLILLLKTDNTIDQDEDGHYNPIISSSKTRYGYYLLATGENGHGYKYEWLQHSKTQLTLDEDTELSLLNSVVIFLEKRPKIQTDGINTSSNYGDKEIEPAIKPLITLGLITPAPGLKNIDINRLKNKEVTLSDATDQPSDSCLKDSGFKAIKHDLSKFVKLEIPGATEVTLIASIRFMIPTPDGAGEYRLLTLKDSSDSTENITLFHQKDNDSVCVFFYGEDPRPLLLCYNNKAYRAFNIFYYDCHWWFKAPHVENCVCDNNNVKKLLVALVLVINFLNPVKIDMKINGRYVVHKFNGNEISIKLESQPSEGKFCYNKYTHTHLGVTNIGGNAKPPETGQSATGFRLGSITYSGKSIEEYSDEQQIPEKKPIKLISSLITDKPNYCPASEIVVYYYKGDSNHTNPLLVALCKKGNGDALNGANISCTYQPYYELQNASKDPNETRKYKKMDTAITLDEKEQSNLEKALNKVRIHIGTTLRVLLNSRSSYKGRLYKGDGKTVFKNVKNQLPFETEIQVSGRSQFKEILKSGYKCYKHNLVEADNDDTLIGGLKLFLWDNRQDNNDDENECKVIKTTSQDNHLTKRKCCEIKLYEKSKPPNGQQDQEIKPIAYTTCKGDLYVYFYGSDPRPLLLCYNNGAYVPTDLGTYSERWCHVKTIESCECSEAGFTDQNLLSTLYGVSMFLNPVKLSETIAAYQKVKKVIDQRKRDKEKGEYKGKLGDKLPEHDYTVQTFGDRDINIRVKATDLQCYRRYTFESAMVNSGGVVKREYRLGNILYGENRDADSTCLKYPQELPLQSVSLYYYMYDIHHNYPLMVQLDYGFQGPLDDYYRVCKTGEGSVASAQAGSTVQIYIHKFINR